MTSRPQPWGMSLAAGLGLLATACSAIPLPGFGWFTADRVASDAAEVVELEEPVAWWETFDDPVLNRVVQSALESNFDLATAVARVKQARARARIAFGARLPTVQASVVAAGFDAPTNVGLGAQLEELGLGADAFAAFDLVLPDRLDQTTYAVAADFAYEVDFWGRDRNAARAAHAERGASEADYRAARMGVLAQTVATYLEVVDLRRQLHLAAETAGILDEWATLLGDRYDRGVGDIRDVYAIRRNLRDAEASLPGIDARLADAMGRLKVLLGGEHADLVDSLPNAMPPAGVGSLPTDIPADLLAQRPDVAAARQRLAAARYALGARRAALLPSLSLSGSIGLQSPDTGSWFDPDQWFRNLTSNLLVPVFQGGRLRGNVALAEAELDEATAAYGRAVVTAAAEVESALAGLRSSQHRAALLTAFAEEAHAEAALQEQRYASGVGDYSIFLAASQMDVAARAARAAGERDLGYARLTLHRALGGAWSRTGEPDAVPENESATAARTTPLAIAQREHSTGSAGK